MEKRDEIYEVPTLLHRYFNAEHGIKALSTSQLFFSNVSAYNDPFEIAPITSYTKEMFQNPDVAQQQVLEMMESDEGTSFLESLGILGIGSAISLGLSLPISVVASVAGLWYLFKSADEDEKKNFTHHMKKYVPLLASAKTCCFSASPDVLLMWSHYAEWHKGMVLSFDTDKNYWRNANFYPMDYQEKRLELPTKKTNPNRYLINLLTRKSIHWKYEQEWRLVDWAMQSKNELPFDPEALKEIRIGLFMSDENRQEVVRLRDEKYPTAKIFVAERDNNDYKLNFPEL